MEEYTTTNRYSETAIVRTFLQVDEELLWTGRPYASVPYRPSLSGVLSSLFMLAFSLFWTATAATGSIIFSLFGLPFIAVSVGTLYHSTVGSAFALKRTLYAITNRRVLIIRETRRGTDCTEYFFSRLHGVDLERVQGSVGCIRLRDTAVHEQYHTVHRMEKRHRQTVQTEGEMRDMLLMIDNVQTVYRMISERIAQK